MTSLSGHVVSIDKFTVKSHDKYSTKAHTCQTSSAYGYTRVGILVLEVWLLCRGQQGQIVASLCIHEGYACHVPCTFVMCLYTIQTCKSYAACTIMYLYLKISFQDNIIHQLVSRITLYTIECHITTPLVLWQYSMHLLYTELPMQDIAPNLYINTLDTQTLLLGTSYRMYMCTVHNVTLSFQDNYIQSSVVRIVSITEYPGYPKHMLWLHHPETSLKCTALLRLQRVVY